MRVRAVVIRELTATAPVVDLRMSRDPTFASGTLIAGVVFAMLMGSMFLLPVFTQEMMRFAATQSGVVDTVSPATGARFSMIPPDNATGNFVKVVQRVPVKIAWTTPPSAAMRPGLSAEVSVHVGS